MIHEDYKKAMDSIVIDENKYEFLISAIERDDYRFRRKAVTAAVTAISISTVLGISAAAESGLFTSMMRAFNTENENIPIATMPSEYAFVPDADSIIGNGVTISFTEAAADNCALFVFMEIVCDEGLLDGIPENAEFCFESSGTKYGGTQGTRFNYREGNVISLYFYSGGIDKWDSETIVGIENFGYLVDGDDGFADFIKISDVKGSIKLPDDQIKRSEPKTAFSEISGIPVKMELSEFGFMLLTDIDVNDVKNYQNDRKYVFSGENFCLYMNDGRIYGDGNSFLPVYELLGAQTAGYIDDSYFEYTGFRMPVDTSQISKIIVNDGEFIFN